MRLGLREASIVAIALIVVAAGLIGSFLLNPSQTIPPQTSPQASVLGLSSFQTYSQLTAFISANAKSAQQYNRLGSFLGGPVFAPGVHVTMTAAMTVVAGAAQSVASTPSFTGTNIQVTGVDEPDIVKTDGTHLFVSNGSSVSIINAYPPNSTRILSTVRDPSASILGIEVSQNRLLVIDTRNSNASYVDLLLYDTTDLSSPKLMQNESIAGNYVAARLAQGNAYAIVQQSSFVPDQNGNLTGVLPSIVSNGSESTLAPSSIYYAGDKDQINFYTFITSLSMSTGKENTISVLTGPSSTVYVSTTNIYVVYANYLDYYADNIPGDIFSGGAIAQGVIQQQEQNSTIFRASYSNGTVSVQAVGTVPGTVLNQYSMDEYNNYFRVATSRIATLSNGTNTRSDDVYVLSQSMSQVSALRNIAPGENLYAVRFVGDMGYVVTFEQIDPLFAISFKDPTNPAILSALKVTGYSDYLYPLPGGYLIGVGKDAVPSSSGNFAWYLGLKLSLFHVFDNGSSAQVSKYLIGDRGTDSPVLNDPLAFTFDSTRNITVLPVLLAKVSGNVTYSPGSSPPYGDYVWQGVDVFRVTRSGFTLLGNVSQYPAGLNYGDSPNNNLQIMRSVIIGNYLYTISQNEVMVSALSNYSTVASLQLGSG